MGMVVMRMSCILKKLRLIWIEKKPFGWNMSCGIPITIVTKRHAFRMQWVIVQADRRIGRTR